MTTSITLTVGNLTKTYVVSDADINRIVAALVTQYGPVGTGNGGTRPMTATEVFNQWTASVISGFNGAVVSTELAAKQAAAMATVVQPVPIVAT